MVALDIWYDQTPKDDERNVVICVNTAAERDALIARIEETSDNVAPPMIQVAHSGVKRTTALEVGLGKEKGFIGCTSRAEGGWTVGNGDADTTVDCIYMGNRSEVPVKVGVPMSTVCQGLHELLVSGARPSVVESDAS
ncbi:Imm1 family immunity protein [Amycolatopsis thailandensis]|uniref:Imm1 family immunity protein n=1 Tax=Amycolatopsis thailandensis TaxID=589330 RepID=UPI003631FCB0